MTNHEEQQLVRALADLRRSSAMRFEDGFSDRVMFRLSLTRNGIDDLAVVLGRQARRVLPAVLAASLALLAWNWHSTHASTDSLLSAALGFRATTAVASAPAAGSPVSGLEGAEAFQ